MSGDPVKFSITVPDAGGLRRARQRVSCVEAALQALVARRRVSELASGSRRRGTAYTYLRAWVDFGLFLRWRLGEDDGKQWATGDHALRHFESAGVLDYLDEHVGEVDVADVQAYVEALLARPVVDRRGRKKLGLENSTVNLRLAAIRHLLRTAVRMGLRDDNPADADHVDRRRASNPYRPRGLDVEQAVRLLESLSGERYIDHRDRVLVLLLLRLGHRREEACELRAEDFVPDDEGGLAVEVTRKGDKRQVLLVPADVAEVVTAYVERWNLESYLFRSCPRGVPSTLPMKPDAVTWMVRARTFAALGKRRGPHVLRHTFVTAAIDAGSPIHEVQRFVGHESPATTERYIDRRTTRATSPAERVSYQAGQTIRKSGASPSGT